ncbi:MAG: Ig domain-containing protein, partial [Treponema sp.]|nr:Ig domain-containing protein [Treponema sp.]
MTTFRKLFIVMAVFLALGIASCRNNSSGTEEPSVTNVPVKGISFDITGDTVDVPGGTTKKIVVLFDPPNATNKKLTWTAETDGVVTIDEEGNVTAVTHKNNDSTKITATSDDGNFTAECTVNVPVKKITSVTLPPIVYGDTFKGVQLTAKIEPEDASYKGVKWDSSDSSKISV